MELLALLEILAGITGFLMSVAYFPQAWKLYRRKSAHDVSLLSYILFAVGSTVWLLWGLLASLQTIVVGYAFGALGSCLVVCLIVYYRFVKKPSCEVVCKAPAKKAPAKGKKH